MGISSRGICGASVTKRLFVIGVAVLIALGDGLVSAALSAQPPLPGIADEEPRSADTEFKDPGILPPMDRSLAIVIAADHLKAVCLQEVVDQVTASYVITRFILFSQRPAITTSPHGLFTQWLKAVT